MVAAVDQVDAEAIGFAHRRRASFAFQGAIALAVVSFTLILAYTATQNPYAAEVAAPGPQFLLLLTTFLGLTLAFERREQGWMALFVALYLAGHWQPLGPERELGNALFTVGALGGEPLIALVLAALLTWLAHSSLATVLFIASLAATGALLAAEG